MDVCLSKPTQPTSLLFEILVEIFSYAHNECCAQRVLRPPPVSQVCRSWRHASLVAKEIWTTIAIRCKKNSDDLRISLAEVYAQRSGDLPLTIAVHSATPHPRLIDLIRRNAWRVKSIAVYSDSTFLFDSLGGQAFPSLESCRLQLSTPIWPNVLLQLRFPSSEYCPRIRDLRLTGGLSEFNFEFLIHQANVLNHYIAYRTAGCEDVDWGRRSTFPFRVFNIFPGMETMTAILVPPRGNHRLDVSLRRVLPIPQHHNIVALDLTCEPYHTVLVPPLPRLKRLALSIPTRSYSTYQLISFFERTGGEIEYLAVRIPDFPATIWERILPLTPKVLAFRAVAQAINALERLLTLTKDTNVVPILPLLHTLCLYYPSHEMDFHCWTVDPLLNMLRSRGWADDEGRADSDGVEVP